jgi:hypothetical protein
VLIVHNALPISLVSFLPFASTPLLIVKPYLARPLNAVVQHVLTVALAMDLVVLDKRRMITFPALMVYVPPNFVVKQVA